ncbi:MAG: beta-propeller fold lactonase family protein [Nitrospirota bacterium]
MKNFTFLVFILIFLLSNSTYAKTLLYVTHEAKQEVVVYDADSEKIIKKIAAKGIPYHIARIPDKRDIAVSLKGERIDYIRIIDPVSGKIRLTPSIIVGRYKKTGEIHLLFNNNGAKLYAIDSDLDYVDVIETKNWQLVKRVILGIEPKGGILTSDGKTLIIPNLNSRDIIFFDILRDKVVSSIKVNGQPSAVAISQDSKHLYVADKENSFVLLVNSHNGDILGRAVVGNDPVNMLLTSDGKMLYVANFLSNSLTVIDTKSMESISNFTVGIRPIGMAMDDKAGRLYVCNYGEASISIIDIKTNRIIRKIPTDATPTNLIIVRE